MPDGSPPSTGAPHSPPIYRAHDSGIPDPCLGRRDAGRATRAPASPPSSSARHGVPHTRDRRQCRWPSHAARRGRSLHRRHRPHHAADGDVCNKIGTYLKALAAKDNGVPFYVAAPQSTIDWSLPVGVGGVEIEERAADEVTSVGGVLPDGTPAKVRIAPAGTRAANPAFGRDAGAADFRHRHRARRRGSVPRRSRRAVPGTPRGVRRQSVVLPRSDA